MFEKMIATYDGSDTGADGLILAMALAKTFGSEVVVVYVYDAELSAESSEAADELARHAEAVLEAARGHVSPVLATRFLALPASSPAGGITELAIAEGADLIVLGSRRLGPRTRDALGAVSQDVIREAPCPVAVATRGYRDHGGLVPRRIGVGWIPTSAADRALHVALEIARASGATVDLLTTTSTADACSDLEDKARLAVEQATAGEGRRVSVAVHAEVGEASDRLIASSGALDLLVLGSHDDGAPRTKQLGRLSSCVVAEASCPTILLRADGSDEARS